MKHRGGQWKRACDICGWNGPFNKLKYIGQGRYACVDDKNGWTAEQIARHQARLKPLHVRPRPHAKLQGEIPTYQGDEGALFNFICQNVLKADLIGPTGFRITAHTGTSAATAGVYLYSLLQENQRPAQWMTTATATLSAIGDYLLTQQYGSPTGPSPSEATSSILYGGVIFAATSVGPNATAQAGLVFLELNTLTGDGKWLAAADRCAWHLRQNQRADLLTVGFVTGSGGGAYYSGAWARGISAAKAVQALFPTSAAHCLWFLARYRDVRGGATSLGISAAAGDFSAPTVGTLQNMIDDAVTFYVVGKTPYSSSDATPTAPLSSTTPQTQATFSASPAFALTASSPYFGVAGSEFALALRGLFELEGYTARVATIFEWLMAFTANPAFATPANTGPSQVAKTLTGDFDPKVAIADFLAVNTAQARVATIATNGTSLYSTVATALLGPIYNASGRILRTWKDALSQKRPLNGDPYDLRSPNKGSTTGLSFQLQYDPWGFGTAVTMSTLATNGLIYRAQPAGYPLQKGLP